LRRAKAFFDELAHPVHPQKLVNLNRDERDITRAFGRTQALRLQDLIAMIAEVAAAAAYDGDAHLGDESRVGQRAA
jgi:hypothetical protein